MSLSFKRAPLAAGPAWDKEGVLNGAWARWFINAVDDVLFAALPDAEDGTIQYCSDAKNHVDNAAVVGSVAVGGGAGSMLVRLNGSWRTMA